MVLNLNKRCCGNTIKSKTCNNTGTYRSASDSFQYCRHHVPKSDDTCVICIVGLYDTYMIPCGHTFHRKCIHKWIKSHNTCPICRCKIYTNIDTEPYANVLRSYEGDMLQIAIDIALVSGSLQQAIHNIEDIGI